MPVNVKNNCVYKLNVLGESKTISNVCKCDMRQSTNMLGIPPLYNTATSSVYGDQTLLLFVYFLFALRGFAFVVFSDGEAVAKVLSTAPHTIDGRQVDAKKAIPHQIHQVSSL